MPIEEITRFLGKDKRDGRKELHMKLAIHCAPFMKGMKVSALLTLPRQQSMELAMLAKKAGLNWYFLFHEGKKDMILLYRRENFLRYLECPEVSSFLMRQGYPLKEEGEGCFWLYRILARLAERMGRYYGSKREFPHEIGIFLGYPVRDVEGYIRNGGQNFLLVGYWKVYEDKERAQRLFAAFDEAREQAVREVLEGKELAQLCASCDGRNCGFPAKAV